jgi:hypothetical protein
VLVQCRSAALAHLCKQLEPIITALADECHKRVQGGRDREERDDYARAVGRLRERHAEFLEGFKKEYGEQFEAATQALQGAGTVRRDASGNDLAMLKTNLLENQVAVGKLAAQLKQAAAAELTQVSARIATLFRRAAVDDGDNPLGPLAIANAVYAGVAELDLPGRVMRAMRPELEQRLVAPVREHYQGLNGALERLGIAPAVPKPAPARPPAQPAASAPATAGDGANPAAPSPASQAAAKAAVSSALHGAGTPAAVALFLQETWTAVLARAHSAQGVDGAAWSESLATMNELLATLRPAPDPAERTRLVGMLPAMLKRLTAGMDAVALDPAKRKAVLDALMPLHRELMRGPSKA